MILRRKKLPAELLKPFSAYLEVVGHLEAAKSALTESVPSTRFAGRPLAESLAEFESRLAEAAGTMHSWRCADVEEAWQIANAALTAARSLAERVRLQGDGPKGFEQLIGLLGDLMSPLDSFEEAVEAFDRLRR